MERYNQNPGDLYINYQCKKIYLLYDSVHFIKNIWSNLVTCKMFIFPSFTSYGFRDIIDLQSGEMSGKILHHVFEKVETLDTNEKKKPKVTLNVFVKLYFWKLFLKYFWWHLQVNQFSILTILLQVQYFTPGTNNRWSSVSQKLITGTILTGFTFLFVYFFPIYYINICFLYSSLW